MIVLDESVLIAYLDGGDHHHRRAEDPLAREIDGTFAVDPLTLAEVLVLPTTLGRVATFDDRPAAAAEARHLVTLRNRARCVCWRAALR